MPEPAVDLVLATSTGGIGMHVRSLAAGLIECGHPVTVHAPRATDAIFGFSTIAQFVPIEIPAGLAPFADLRVVRQLHSQLDGEVVHAHGVRAGLVAGLALGPIRAGRQPLVTTWHNALLETGLRAAAWRWAATVVARRSDLSLGASADLVEAARVAGARRARLGPVAAPSLPRASRTRSAVRDELGCGERPLVVAIARLHPQKGLRTLIDAASVMRTPEALVVVAGDGPQRAELEARIARTGAPMRLLGRRSDVADLLGAADVAVIASRWEARALVAQEALLAGVPLVSTAVGGIPELVGDAARLVPSDDPPALALALDEVLGDRALADGLIAVGRRQAVQWPDEAAVVRDIQNVYDELLAGGR